jgi:formamidopyrimidine-DNA glycosylase
MPELPEVEGFRKYFDETSLNKKIVETDLPAPKMLKESSPSDLEKYTVGYKFISSMRHGKYFFAGLSSKKFLMLHFGMTGYLISYKDPAEASKHIRLQFKFSDGTYLAYDNLRRFGQIMLVDNVDEFIKKKRLGPDPLKDKMTFKDFKVLIEKKSGTIKSILMDQSVLSGIGNLYSDEIAYHTGVHPSISIQKISEDKLKELYKNMITVLRKASDNEGERDQMPGKYLVNHRIEGEKCPVCGGTIIHKTIAGRTSYFCKSHQKLKV